MRIPGRVIVRQDDGRRVGEDCRFEHFPGMDQRRGQTSSGDVVKAQGAVPAIEQEDPERFPIQVSV